MLLVSEGQTVLYRPSDIAYLEKLLAQDGHKVRPIRITFGDAAIDKHVDVPPYTHNPHLRLRLMEYDTTSIGLVVERG